MFGYIYLRMAVGACGNHVFVLGSTQQSQLEYCRGMFVNHSLGTDRQRLTSIYEQALPGVYKPIRITSPLSWLLRLLDILKLAAHPICFGRSE